MYFVLHCGISIYRNNRLLKLEKGSPLTWFKWGYLLQDNFSNTTDNQIHHMYQRVASSQRLLDRTQLQSLYISDLNDKVVAMYF